MSRFGQYKRTLRRKNMIRKNGYVHAPGPGDRLWDEFHNTDRSHGWDYPLDWEPAQSPASGISVPEHEQPFPEDVNPCPDCGGSGMNYIDPNDYCRACKGSGINSGML